MMGRNLLGTLAVLAMASAAAGQVSPSASPGRPTKLLRAPPKVTAPRNPKVQQQNNDELRSTITAGVEDFRATLPAKVWLSPDQRTIYLVGDIEEDTDQQFAEVAKAAPMAKTVFLASAGGFVEPSYRIGTLVRARQLDTWVEHECISACTQIFAAGQQRLLGQQARLGFHQTYSENPRSGETTGTDYSNKADLELLFNRRAKLKGPRASDQLLVVSLRWANAPDSFLTKVLRTPPDETWNPPHAELLSVGMATGVTGAAPGLPLPAAAVSRAAVAGTLLRQRFWQALKRRDPARYDRAELEVWRETNSGMLGAESARSALSAALIELRPQIATAPDALLDRLIKVLASNAERQRFNGFPACSGRIPLRANMNAVGNDAALNAAGDVFAELLDSPAQAAPLTSKAALKLLEQDTALNRVDNVDLVKGGIAARRDCRLIHFSDEAVDQLEGTRRLKVARAWLSLDLLGK